MRHFPIFLDLHDQDVLLVGGAAAAAAKLRLLAASGARIAAILPAGAAHEETNAELARLARIAPIAIAERAFQAADLDGKTLVFAATGDPAHDRRIAAAARARNLPVNAPDRPDISSFVMPAIVDRQSVVVAISTGGAAPILARRLRERLEVLLPSRLGRLADFARAFRPTVRQKLGEPRRWRCFWEALFDGPIAKQVLAGDEVGARRQIMAALAGLEADQDPADRFHILGVDPEAPDLLSLRALRRLQAADLLVFDRAVPAEALDHGRREAERLVLASSADPNAAKIGKLLGRIRSGAKAVWLTTAPVTRLRQRLAVADAGFVGLLGDRLPALPAALPAGDHRPSPPRAAAGKR